VLLTARRSIFSTVRAREEGLQIGHNAVEGVLGDRASWIVDGAEVALGGDALLRAAAGDVMLECLKIATATARVRAEVVDDVMTHWIRAETWALGEHIAAETVVGRSVVHVVAANPR